MNTSVDKLIYYPLMALAGLLIGILAIMAMPQTGATAGVDPAILATLPAVRVAVNAEFEPVELHARTGEIVALQLKNDDGPMHTFDIDAFNVHVPMPFRGTGLALFKPAQP